jgi:hypothetical protein
VTPQQVRPALGGLLQNAQVLLHLAENQLEHLAMAGIGDACDSRPPAIDEGFLTHGVCIDNRPLAVARGFAAHRIQRIGRRTTQGRNRIAQPLEMDFLPPDDLLITIVRVVTRNRLRVRLPRLEQFEGVSMELVENLQQFGRAHVVCFALQLMQTRVQGIATSRGSAMGSPQSRHTPYVPF